MFMFLRVVPKNNMYRVEKEEEKKKEIIHNLISSYFSEIVFK